MRTRYAERHPGWNVVVASSPPGAWVKAHAVSPAIESSSADVVIVADADVWVEGMDSAVRAVVCGAGDWAVPHAPDVRRLSEEGTQALLEGAPWKEQALAERAYRGVVGGGIVIAPRELLLDVPLDPRFVGYGTEDVSWGYALRCLHGEPWRGENPLIHLYHPSQERLSRRYGSLESKRLGRRYYAARKDPKAMRSLIGETCDSTARPTRTSTSEPLPTG